MREIFKTLILIQVILMASLIPTHSQVGSMDYTSGDISIQSTNIGLNKIMRTNNASGKLNLDNIAGSPYLIDEWWPATIITKYGPIPDKIKLKYDCFSGQLEALKEGSENALVVNTDLVLAFDINMPDSILHFRKHIVSNKSTTDKFGSFYQILYEGEISLLNYHSKVIRNYDSEPSLVEDDNRPRLVHVEELFLLKKDGSNVSLLKNNRKSILDFFGYHEESVKVYMKENKLNFKRREDVQNILSYYEKISQ